MQCYLSLHLYYALFILTQVHITHASPAAIGAQPSLPALNASTNEVHLHCFTPGLHPERPLTNVNDCKNALALMVLEPNFITPYRFSKNSRRFDVIPVPKGWTSGDCIIFVSCENDRDTDVFRLADVAGQARKIIQACVEGQATPHGGINGVGTVGTFYVSVGKPLNARVSSTSRRVAGSTVMGNATLLGPGVSTE